MKKQYEAYYSPNWAWFWVFLATIFAIGIALFSVLWLGSISIIFIIAFSVCILVFLLMFIKTKNQTGIAVEIVTQWDGYFVLITEFKSFFYMQI